MKTFLIVITLLLTACGGSPENDGGPRRRGVTETLTAENPTASLSIPRGCDWDVSLDQISHDAERALVGDLELPFEEKTALGLFFARTDDLITRGVMWIEEKKAYKVYLVCWLPGEVR